MGLGGGEGKLFTFIKHKSTKRSKLLFGVLHTVANSQGAALSWQSERYRAEASPSLLFFFFFFLAALAAYGSSQDRDST